MLKDPVEAFPAGFPNENDEVAECGAGACWLNELPREMLALPAPGVLPIALLMLSEANGSFKEAVFTGAVCSPTYNKHL